MIPTQKKARLVVLVSGNGSNLQAIIDACATETLNAEIVLVVSNKSDAYALKRAAQAKLSCAIQLLKPAQARENYDAALAELVEKQKPDYIVLAGWMRLLTNTFLSRFPQQVVNLHPALPGEFPGIRAIERAYAEFQAGTRQHTGVMVHFVPDEGVDDGPVLNHTRVTIEPHDTLETLSERMHAEERKLLISTLKELTNKK